VATSHKGEGLISAEWAEAARAQLARLLDSPQFRSSKRCSAFLRHVVEHAAEGRFDSLKERTIGVEVFERDPNYDTNQDPVVRSTAGEVRKRLAQYYTGPGREDHVLISLPTGSYVAEVRVEPPAPAAPPVSTPPAPAPAPAVRRVPWTAIVSAVVLAAAAGAFLLTRSTGLDAFWQPVFAPKQPLLVCVGQPHVYKFAGGIQDRMNAWFDKAGPEPGAVAPPDIVPLWDRYLSLGDIQAFSRVSGYFGKQGKPFEMRGVRSVSLADLRRRPVLLIGAFNNEWTLGLGSELRFYFEQDVPNGRFLVRDRQNPNHREWQLAVSAENRQIAADYALATRVFNSNTEQYVVVAAGITEIGTLAASEFLTTPEYFAEALAGAPSDWKRKNIQVVLSAKVMSGTAGPPHVLAVHFW
jgi:hypothetical protein